MDAATKNPRAARKHKPGISHFINSPLPRIVIWLDQSSNFLIDILFDWLKSQEDERVAITTVNHSDIRGLGTA